MPLETRVRMRNTGLVILSLVLSILVAEFFVRIFVTVRDVGPSFTTYDPYFGKRLKRSFNAERITPEFRMRLATNSFGFRGPEPTRFPSDPVLFLGDSFTMGYGVSDGSEFPSRIDAELRRRHGASAPTVVNAGIGDSGNGFWVKFLRLNAKTINPRLVVMQVLDNDFVDNVSEGLFALKADGSLDELPIASPGAGRRLQGLVEAVPGLSNSYLIGLARQVRLPNLLSNGTSNTVGAVAQSPDPNDRLTYRLVEEALEIGAARGWRMLGLFVGLSADRQRRTIDLFARHGVPVVISPSKRERPDLFYSIDGHWNDKGHAHAAEQVLRAIDEHTIQFVEKQ